MPLMTKEQYIESLKKLNLKVYMFGKPVKNIIDDPIIRPSLNSVALTYEMAQKEEYKDLMLAKSVLTGKSHQQVYSPASERDDLVKKS